MKLRLYQRQSIDAALSMLNKMRRTIVVSPTGSGKTVMAAEVAKRVRKAKKICWAVSHRQEINSQLKAKLGCPTFSIQSLCSSSELPSGGAPDLVIIDEVHHYKAPQWSTLFELYPDAKFLGFTATPSPGLGAYFDEMVVAAQYPDLVRKGYLAKVRIVRPNSFCGPDLAYSPVKAYEKYCKGERAFLFAPTREASLFHSGLFNEADIRAVHLDATTPSGERQAALELFRKWDIDVICNVQILTEGVDVPEASCCILAGNSSSSQSYLQKTGRVLRPHASKNWATVLDLVGSSWLYGSPIERRDYSLTAGIEQLPFDSVRDCPQCAWAGGRVASCPVCAWDFASNSKRKREARIFSKELEEVWCGSQTPKPAKVREFERLSYLAKTRGFSLGWVCSSYKKVFKEAPKLDLDQKMQVYFEMVETVLEKGHKLGSAFYRYRSLLSECPKKRWVDEAKKESAKRGQTK